MVKAQCLWDVAIKHMHDENILIYSEWWCDMHPNVLCPLGTNIASVNRHFPSLFRSR